MLQRHTPMARGSGFSQERVTAQKTCSYDKCGRPFVPARPMQNVCGPVCARKKGEAENKAKKAAEKALDSTRREAAKRRGKLQSEAQDAFNAYIRFRDAGRPCICCGKPFEPQKPGGSMDAGHYMSRGASPQLRFDEANVHGQRKNCNRPGGTTRAAFRAGMIERVGLAEVERLEADSSVAKFAGDDFRRVRDTYKAKLKALKKEAA